MVEEKETQTEEDLSIDDELRLLYDQSQDMVSRFNKHADRLLEKKGDAASKADVAELYRVLVRDVVSLMSDVIAATGASFTEVVDMYDSGNDDNEDDDTIDDETLQIYSTLQANVNACKNLLSSAAMPESGKETFNSLLTMNLTALKSFDDQFGESIKQAFDETLKQAQANGSEEEKAKEESAASPA